ncbi:hypothetical protein [Mycolicibacterium fortuitum]|uniref:Uncharacterized protein n=2 Tax=Mycolicibacterium fortuitum TaxID=1766 RepID=A0AAE4V948_MYCFO|nr:hypothetical protein [Mycolicibacterium fortuitum]MCV7141405.1 hypothetical protein [Mycolicibacterium fortuitum]MDV7189601.1 hypothetical protein [Mycolicibacterium fortuitum]MDV7203102.1 hypothetical protein [Mycolicibacterium fortuitum]MDV7224682.1 hypothetical protein [Mycolicibacterium fortuitum]MDV7256804.1 hypothetical protein [Mycolicibacterium fortuitum]
MTNPTPSLPDELSDARAWFLRLCVALASGSPDGIAQVLAELSCHHAAAWQLTLQAAAREHVALLGVHTGLDPAGLAGLLERQAMDALDAADEANDRLTGD